MTDIVVDSGILITSVFVETFTSHAKSLLRSWVDDTISLHAPALIKYEVVAVARKAVYQGRLTAEEGQEALLRLLGIPIITHMEQSLHQRAFELAVKFNRPRAYDTQYLALAEHLACPFWTADERLYNAVKDSFSHIHWLGNYKP